MCEKIDFLKNCRLKNCPVCEQILDIDFTSLAQRDLVFTAFFYHVQQENVAAVEKILSSGLIPEELKNRVFQQRPAFASEFAKFHFAKTQPIEALDQTTLPSNFSNHQTVYKHKLEYPNLKQLIKMKLQEHPSISLPELQKYAKYVLGEKYSLSLISQIINN